MTTPVTAEDIVGATVKWLLTKSSVTSAVGMFTVSGKQVPGIFQYRLWAGQFEGASSSAIVITNEGGWATPNPHNTMRFPRVVLNVWCDPLRDDGHNATNLPEVQRRAMWVFEQADKYLHIPGGDTMIWGETRVISSVRLVEPVLYTVPDGDGIVRLQAYYAVTQG